jgi:two-component system nitrate/nitrite response regulator NarL
MQSAQSSKGETIRVLVADDTQIHTQLLADALRRDPQLEVFDPPLRTTELIETVKRHRVSVVVISSKLDEEALRGFEILRQLRESDPQIVAVVLLESSKRDSILQAFRAGARGIFSRYDSVDSLAKCIKTVFGGQVWANSEQISFAVDALAASPMLHGGDGTALSLLSKREMDVVRSLAEGLTNREIGERLGLSQHTIKNYLFRVYDKLGVSSRLELLFMTLTQAGAAHSMAQVSRPRPAGKPEESEVRYAHPSSSSKDLKPAHATDTRSEAKSRTSTTAIGTDPLG